MVCISSKWCKVHFTQLIADGGILYVFGCMCDSLVAEMSRVSGAVTCDDTINVYGSRDREPCFGSKTRLMVASGESSSGQTARLTRRPGPAYF